MDVINRYLAVAKPYPAAAQAAPSQTAQHAADAAQKPLNQDTLALSAEDRQRALNEALQQKLQEKDAQNSELLEQLKSANAQIDSMQKAAEIESKCFLIAMRIMAGDKVPPADTRFLAQNNTELYAQALTLRRANDHPKTHKQVSGEDSVRSAQEFTNDSGVELPLPEGEASGNAGDSTESSPEPPTPETASE